MRINKKIRFVVLILLITFMGAHSINAFVPERRRPQTSDKPNRYYVLPWVLNIEGIGTLWGGVLGVANILDSGANIGLFNFQNDKFHIFGAGIDDIYLVGDYNSFGALTISGASTNVKLLEFDVWDVGPDSDSKPMQVKGELDGRGVQLQQKLFHDRLRISAEAYVSTDYMRVQDQEGEGVESTHAGNRLKMELDLTDDRYDPRKGIKLYWITSRTDPKGNFFAENESDEEYELVKREISLFIPLYNSPNHNHTLAFDFFLSTLHNLNEDVPISRRNGHSLGGPLQLRGYPVNRFTDSNAVHYIMEHRWTILTPNDDEGDSVFSNDRLEGIQFAFFHEWGRVSEFSDERLFEEELKTSYGVGCRLVMMSGIVIRLDVGFSEEGDGVNFIIQQPF